MQNDILISTVAAEPQFESKKRSAIHGMCSYSFPCRTETLVAANDLYVKYPHGTKRKETSEPDLDTCPSRRGIVRQHSSRDAGCPPPQPHLRPSRLPRRTACHR